MPLVGRTTRPKRLHGCLPRRRLTVSLTGCRSRSCRPRLHPTHPFVMPSAPRQPVRPDDRARMMTLRPSRRWRRLNHIAARPGPPRRFRRARPDESICQLRLTTIAGGPTRARGQRVRPMLAPQGRSPRRRQQPVAVAAAGRPPLWYGCCCFTMCQMILASRRITATRPPLEPPPRPTPVYHSRRRSARRRPRARPRRAGGARGPPPQPLSRLVGADALGRAVLLQVVLAQHLLAAVEQPRPFPAPAPAQARQLPVLPVGGAGDDHAPQPLHPPPRRQPQPVDPEQLAQPGGVAPVRVLPRRLLRVQHYHLPAAAL